MIERQELYCHGCGKYVQFNLDLELDGNHVLECPNCGHEHCRVVKNGKITDIRWDSRNGLPTHAVSSYTITVSSNSTFNYYSSNTTGGTASSSSFTYNCWLNTANFS